MQRGRLRIGARIARNHVQLMHGHIKLAAFVVVQVQEFLVALTHVQRDQTLVAANAMLAMHDGVADLEFGQIAHHRIDGTRLFLLAPARAACRAGVEFGLGYECHLGRRQREAGLQRCHRDREMRIPRQEGCEVVNDHRAQAAFREQLQQRLASAGGVGAHQHTRGLVEQQRFQVDQRIFSAAIDRYIGQVSGEGGRVGRRGVALQYQSRQRLCADEELFFRQEQVRWRQQRPLAVMTHEVVALGSVGPEAANGLVHIAREGKLGALGQIVEQRRALLEEQRQVVLDTGRRHAIADVLVNR